MRNVESCKRGEQVPGGENRLHKRQNGFFFFFNSKSHERTVRRQADSRLTGTSEIMKGKRMNHLKKQRRNSGFTDSEIQKCLGG